LTEIGTKKVF